MRGPRSPILARVLLATLMLLGTPAACRSSAEPDVSDDSLFVITMAELRRIRTDPALDSAARDSARAATLQSHGVSADELEAMARGLAQDPERALEAWREIERLAERDTTHGSREVEESDSPESDSPR